MIDVRILRDSEDEEEQEFYSEEDFSWSITSYKKYSMDIKINFL